MTPLIHPSCEQSRVVGNRRDIEDKLLAFLSWHFRCTIFAFIISKKPTLNWLACYLLATSFQGLWRWPMSVLPSVIQGMGETNGSARNYVSWNSYRDIIVSPETIHYYSFDVVNLRGFAAVNSVHKQHGFGRAKILLGALGPITRARVCDLISDDADRPCSPAHRELWPQVEVHWCFQGPPSRCTNLLLKLCLFLVCQVQQRGTQGTKEILVKLLDGLDLPADSQVFVTELVPNKCRAWTFWETAIGKPEVEDFKAINNTYNFHAVAIYHLFIHFFLYWSYHLWF